ncbi:MAG: nucleotidyltransferase family protein [Lachnospiraceae bacterium]|nr:nucleotidyltransferase family protein [Lachnospiraceae bacterium]
MNEDIKKYLSLNNISIVEAMQKIDANSRGILYITDEKECLIGSLSDGDIRRWIIKTGNLSGNVYEAMNTNVISVLYDSNFEYKKYMEEKGVTSLPIVDYDNKIKDIFFRDKLVELTKNNESLKEIPVIVMAGGKGTRLYPFTKILPKPLIPIGDIPILERIFNRFCYFGTNTFYLIVNYKKDMIRSYFNDLNPEYSIKYIEEEKALGTAGGLRLIDDDLEGPVIITNCDILIEADYGKIIDYHRESHNDLTIVSSLKNVTIPYGVLKSEEHGRVVSLEEKPTLSYFINTGMYVINAEHLKKIPNDTVYHMTNLVNELMKERLRVGMYPISENSYLDMGQLEEMKRMEEQLNVSSNMRN